MSTDLATIPERDVSTPLSFQQAKLAGLIADGMKKSEAGKLAGYASNEATYNALRRPRVAAEIARMRAEQVDEALATRTRVIGMCMRIMDSHDATPAEKIRAGRLVAEMRGFLKEDRRQTQPRSRFDGMTLEELEEQERLYDRLEAES